MPNDHKTNARREVVVKGDRNNYKRRKNKRWGVAGSRTHIYYWYDTVAGRRLPKVFFSRKSAIEWRDYKYFRYARYATLEDYLDSLYTKRYKMETANWKRDRDMFFRLALYRGVVEWEPKMLWRYEVDENGDRVSLLTTPEDR